MMFDPMVAGVRGFKQILGGEAPCFVIATVRQPPTGFFQHLFQVELGPLGKHALFNPLHGGGLSTAASRRPLQRLSETHARLLGEFAFAY